MYTTSSSSSSSSEAQVEPPPCKRHRTDVGLPETLKRFSLKPILHPDHFRPCSLLEMVACDIGPSLASFALKAAEKVFKFEKMSFLKRMKQSTEKDVKRLTLLLWPKDHKDEEHEGHDQLMKHFTQVLLDRIKLSSSPKAKHTPEDPLSTISPFFFVNVPLFEPINKQQGEEWAKIWPLKTRYVFDVSKVPLHSLVPILISREEERLDLIRHNVQRAIDQALLAHSSDQLAIGAVVVDPKAGEIVAEAYDMRGGEGGEGEGHPLHHATMRVIAAVGQKLEREREILKESGDEEMIEREQYLCSGYHLYVTREPCVMCTMAALHSRVEAILFLQPNPVFGGIVSRALLHVNPLLNHHALAFRIEPQDP